MPPRRLSRRIASQKARAEFKARAEVGEQPEVEVIELESVELPVKTEKKSNSDFPSNSRSERQCESESRVVSEKGQSHIDSTGIRIRNTVEIEAEADNVKLGCYYDKDPSSLSKTSHEPDASARPDTEPENASNSSSPTPDIRPTHSRLSESLGASTPPEEAPSLTELPPPSPTGAKKSQPECSSPAPLSPEVQRRVNASQARIARLNEDIPNLQNRRAELLARFRLHPLLPTHLAAIQSAKGRGDGGNAQTANRDKTQTSDPVVLDENADKATLLKLAKTINDHHIRRLHDYNSIRDLGLGLMGMIADKRGVRLVEVQQEMGIDTSD